MNEGFKAVIGSQLTTGKYEIELVPVSDYYDNVRVTAISQVKPVGADNLLLTLLGAGVNEALVGAMVAGAQQGLERSELERLTEPLALLVSGIYNPDGKLQKPVWQYVLKGDKPVSAYFIAHYRDGPAEVATIKVVNPDELRRNVLGNLSVVEKSGFRLMPSNSYI